MRKNKDQDLLKKDMDRAWEPVANILDELSFNDGLSLMLTLNSRYLNGMWKCVHTHGKKEIGWAVKSQYNQMLDEKLI